MRPFPQQSFGRFEQRRFDRGSFSRRCVALSRWRSHRFEAISEFQMRLL